MAAGASAPPDRDRQTDGPLDGHHGPPRFSQLEPQRSEGFDQRPQNGEADEGAEESGDEGHRPVQPIARLLHGTINLSTCDA